jgi:hypothetical protein
MDNEYYMSLFGFFAIAFYSCAAVAVIAPVIYAIVKKNWNIILSEAIILTVLALLIGFLERGGWETNRFSTTMEYRNVHSFFLDYPVGMEKDDVSFTLDYPDGYLDGEGVYHDFPFENRRQGKEEVLKKEVQVWIYTGYMLPESREPYRMTVTFDENGKMVSAQFEMIPEG